MKIIVNNICSLLDRCSIFLLNHKLNRIAKLFKSISSKIENIIEFVIYSLAGLFLDFIIYSTLIYCFEIRVFYANLCSVFVAATIAYTYLGSRIFRNLAFTAKQYYFYVSFQVLFTFMYTYLIVFLNEKIIHQPIISKVFVVFISVFCNYAFFAFFMKRKEFVQSEKCKQG